MTTEELSQIVEDPQQAAEAAGLIYVTDQASGWRRVRNGRGFVYLDARGRRLLGEKTLNRVKSLVIPPAWEDVWICPLPHGHLQVTGVDQKKRKQYKYHPLWVKMRNETKYYRLALFADQLSGIRRQVEADLRLRKLNSRKALAIAVDLMEHSAIRIGSETYKKIYGSFGISTLRNKHVQIRGSHIYIQFKGKKGVYQNVSLKSKRLARLVKKCKDIPGYELFQFYDEEGNKHKIDSGMINDYICQITGHKFTSKDFRTWAGTVYAYQAFRSIGDYSTKTELKKNIVKAVDMVAGRLGNTRSVSRKYYIHPAVIEAYENKTLSEYFDKYEERKDQTGLSADEQTVKDIISGYELVF